MHSRKAYHSSALAALPFELRLQIYSHVFINTIISPLHTKDLVQHFHDIVARVRLRHPKLQSLTLALRQQPGTCSYYLTHIPRYIKFTSHHLRDLAFLTALRGSVWEIHQDRCWHNLLDSQHMPFFAHQLKHLMLDRSVLTAGWELKALPMLESVVLGGFYSNMSQDRYTHAPDEVFLRLVMRDIKAKGELEMNWSEVDRSFKLSLMVTVMDFGLEFTRNCLIDYDNQTVQRNVPKLSLNNWVCCPPRRTSLYKRSRYLRIRLQWLLLVLPTIAFLIAVCAVMVSLETKMVEHLPGKAPRTPLRWLGDPLLVYSMELLGDERCLLLKEYWTAGRQAVDACLVRASALVDPARGCVTRLLDSPQGLLLQEHWMSWVQVLDAWLHREWYLGDHVLAYATSLLDSPQGLRVREYLVYGTGGVNDWLHRVWASLDRRMCPSWL